MTKTSLFVLALAMASLLAGGSASALRLTISFTRLSTHFSTGQMRNGGAGWLGHGWPSGQIRDWTLNSQTLIII